MPKKSKKTDSFSQSVFSGLFWKFGERILAQAVSFVVSIVLARVLFPEQYGTVAIVLIFISFADIFVTSGFSTALIQKKDADEVDFSSIFYCSLVTSILVYAVLFFAAPFIADFYNMPELTLVTRIFALRVLLSAYNSVQHAYVSRKMIFKKFFFSTLFGTLLSGVVGIALAYAGAGVWALVAQYLTNSLVDSIVLSFTIEWHPKLLFSWSASKKLIRYGWKIFAADFSGNFLMQLKSLVIGKAYSSTDLAYYNRGNSLVSLVTDNIRSSIMSVLFPAIANIEDDKERVKTVTRKSIQVMSFVIFPAAIGFIVVADPLITTLLTEKWLPAVFFLRIAAATTIIEMVGHIALQSLKAIGRSDLILINEILNKPLFLLLLFVGVSRNIQTMCVLLVISSVFGTFINLVACKKSFNYKFHEMFSDVFSALIISVIMGVLISALSLLAMPTIALLIVQVIAGIAIYIALSIIFKNSSYMYLMDLVKKKVKHGK